MISEKNIDSLPLLPFKEKEGFSDGVFPFAEIKLAIKNAIWTNIVTLIPKNLTRANCLQLIGSCFPLHSKGK